MTLICHPVTGVSMSGMQRGDDKRNQRNRSEHRERAD
jgi:hypothetical protein